MRWLGNLKTGWKLTLSFGFCIACMVSLSLFTTVRMASFQSVQAEALTNMAAMTKIISDAKQLRIFTMRRVYTEDADNIANLDKQMPEKIAQVNAALGKLESALSHTGSRTHFTEMQTRWKEYLTLHETLLSMLNKNAKKRAVIAYAEGEMLRHWMTFSATLDKAATETERLATLSMQAEVMTINRMMWCVTLGAIIICLTICFYLIRYFTSTLAQIQSRLESLATLCIPNLGKAVQAMALGDLTTTIKTGTTPIPIRYQDDLGKLSTIFNGMLTEMQGTIGAFREAQAGLRHLVGEVASSVEQVNDQSQRVAQSADQSKQAMSAIAKQMQEVTDAANQAATTSQEIAQGSEQQATNAAQVSSAMERLERLLTQVQSDSRRQIAATQNAEGGMQRCLTAVEQVAVSAQEMRRASAQATEIAGQGGQAVEATMKSMARISRADTDLRRARDGVGTQRTGYRSHCRGD